MEISATKFISKNMGSLNEQRLVGKYCDLTILCRGKQFSVHKNVLASGSEYFETMFESGFKESKSDEIELEGLCPDSLEVVLEYLYTGHMKLNLDVAVQALNTFTMMMLDEAVQQIDSQLVKEASTNPQGVLDVVLEFSGLGKAREAIIEWILKLVPAEKSVILRKLNSDLMASLIQKGGKKCNAFFSDIVEWLKERSESDAAHFVEKLDLSQISTSNVLVAFETLSAGTKEMDALLFKKCLELYKNDKRCVINFTIPGISKLGAEWVDSKKVGLSGLLWHCAVKREKDTVCDSMSLSLWCCGNSEIRSFECEVLCTYTLLGVENFRRGVSRAIFTTSERGWGKEMFMSWKTLLDPKKGFVTKNEARIEVEIVIESVSIVWRQ